MRLRSIIRSMCAHILPVDEHRMSLLFSATSLALGLMRCSLARISFLFCLFCSIMLFRSIYGSACTSVNLWEHKSRLLIETSMGPLKLLVS
jgi:hypothetical protein